MLVEVSDAELFQWFADRYNLIIQDAILKNKERVFRGTSLSGI